MSENVFEYIEIRPNKILFFNLRKQLFDKVKSGLQDSRFDFQSIRFTFY